jgi:hypothetical protein
MAYAEGHAPGGMTVHADGAHDGFRGNIRYRASGLGSSVRAYPPRAPNAARPSASKRAARNVTSAAIPTAASSRGHSDIMVHQGVGMDHYAIVNQFT